METKRLSEPSLDNSKLIDSNDLKINNSSIIRSSDSERPPILSPRANHKDYNRFKYYSALRTGYKHLTPETKDSFLNPPAHILD